MTGSAGAAVDVLVTCDSSNGRRVWEEGGEISAPSGPTPGILNVGGFFQKYCKRYTLETFGFSADLPRSFKSMAGAILEAYNRV